MTVFLLFCIGLFLLILGAKRFVESSEMIARYYGISEMIIGMFIVGIGTSLPELFISSTASRQGHGSVALANVVGSNIANIALIG
jgi:cation:H+ antiporter